MPLTPRSSKSLAATVVVVAFAAIGCDEHLKQSEQGAVDELARLAPVAKEDFEQLRRGLPAGAALLGKGLDADAIADRQGLQRAIASARAHVPELETSRNSVFFAFADTSGVVLRSEIDPDSLAGKSIVGVFPALSAALKPGSGNAEAFGEMAEMRIAKSGPDAEWVLAHPVNDAKGQPAGMFVTGWSMRHFAYHLEEVAKRQFDEAATRAGKKKTPLFYAFIVKAANVYGGLLLPTDSPHAPALAALDVVAKTAAGPYRGSVSVSERKFGVAAQRLPELGDDAALAVLVSEY